MAILGVALVVLNDVALPRPSWLREVGFVTAAAGLPLFLMGLAVTLPSTKLERGAVGLGSLMVAGAVSAFSVWYPDAWHLTVQAPNGYAIGGYLVGMTLISAGTSSCLARHLIESARPVAQAEAEDEQRDWSEADVREDIRWAEKQGWTWGGIPQARPQTQITLEDDVERVEFKGQGKQFVTTEESVEQPKRGSEQLRAMRGRLEEDRSSTDSDVEAQVGDLKELQRRKQQQQQKRQQSWAWRLKHPIKWLRNR